MRIGICLPQLGPAAGMPLVADFAREAELAGFDSVWVQEHLFRPLDPVTGYGGVPGVPWPEQHRNLLAPLGVLSFVAARTRRVTVGSSILVAGYHHPVVLAKEAATLDVLSGGRFALGLGVGWSAAEFALLGRALQDRGSLADEVLEVLSLCWSGGPFEHQGRHFVVPLCETSPRPVRGDRVPTYGGFVSSSGWDRVARWCDVWQPFRLAPGKAVECLGEINRIARDRYDRASLEVSLRVLVSPVVGSSGADAVPGHWSGDVDTLADRVGKARDEGCHELVLDCNFARGSENVDFWERLVERLAPLVTVAHARPAPSSR